MRTSILVVLALSLTPTRPAQPAADGETETLRRLTFERFESNARNDRGYYERLLAPAFLIQEPHRFPPRTRQEYLEAEFPAGRARRPATTITGFDAVVNGDTAVVRYEAAEPYPIGGGQRFETRSRRLDTYVRLGGAWRLLSMAIAEPPSWPEAATIDARRYASYAGVYEWSPDTSIVVTHEGGRLFARVTGQARVELFPENATTFFDRTDSPLARTVFELDAHGRVVAQTYRAQGQTLRARKVK